MNHNQHSPTLPLALRALALLALVIVAEVVNWRRSCAKSGLQQISWESRKSAGSAES